MIMSGRCHDRIREKVLDTPSMLVRRGLENTGEDARGVVGVALPTPDVRDPRAAAGAAHAELDGLGPGDHG